MILAAAWLKAETLLMKETVVIRNTNIYVLLLKSGITLKVHDLHLKFSEM